jgi:cellulose synthase/poly-beta-1,6-N-acetylglucosamine synthase-like glycosyltransferase
MGFAVSARLWVPTDLDPLVDVESRWRPTVSVLVAAHNEELVVDTLIDRLASLEYPQELLEILVVDDGSTDDTGRLLDAAVARHGGKIKAIHRPAGSGGGKSGALNSAARQATGEVIVVFDADHEPHQDVLFRLVRHFEDPRCSAVMGRCIIKNPEHSQLARTVAVDYGSGYLVNEYGRQAVFELPAYGGANCAVRASMLHALGGWNERTVTEDTDITLRILLDGQRVRYDVTAIDEEEAVVDFKRFWSQRYRWARGHQQVMRDYLRGTWRCRSLNLAERVETTMFLASFHVPVLCALGVALAVGSALGVVPPGGGKWQFIALIPLLFAGPLVELANGLLLNRAPRRAVWAIIWFLPAFFVSMALCTKAYFDGLAGRSYNWVKTARTGTGTSGECVVPVPADSPA